MNIDTFEKISNVLWGISGISLAAMIFFINIKGALAVLLTIAVGCYILREWLFNKFCKKNNSQEEEL